MYGTEQWLVTGGTGFIGRFVVRSLLRRGQPVRLLCRDEAKARRLFGTQVSLVTGNLRAAVDCQRACHDVPVVIHIGGCYRFGRREQPALLATNVQGTGNLLAAAWDNRVTRFVHVSSAGVLEARSAMITEHDFPAHVGRCESYRHSKWRAECAALDWARRGLPVVIASPTVPLGPEDEAPTPSGQMVADFLAGRFPFGSRTGLNIVHVADLAEGIVAAAERGRLGERYLLGQHNVSLIELLRILAVSSGRRSPRFCLPWGLVALAGQLGELAGSGRLCRETACHARRRSGYACHKAAAELAWEPNRPLKQTAHETVAWFRQRLDLSAAALAELSVRSNVAY